MTTERVDAAASDDGEAVCYLCLGGGVDDDAGQPLRRDCACRGSDAGFVHFDCLTEYAATKSELADKKILGMIEIEFVKPWLNCPSCHQKYQNELAVDIATEFVLFVRRQYPDDTQRQVEALYVKLGALSSMLDRLQPRQKIEVGVTANVLLSMIDDRLKRETSLPRRYSSFAAFAHNVHGRIALGEGTEESARMALTHFENQLEVYKVGEDEGIASAKQNIAIAKSKCEGGNIEEVLKASQEVYELRIAQLGEEDHLTIHAGKKYSIDLHNANRRDEARELLMKLLATSKQVLGPNHNTTKEVALALDVFCLVKDDVHGAGGHHPLASEDREALCVICALMGERVDEAGQQVRRDCACPGTDAGFVHLSCLTNYAIAKNKGWDGGDS